MALQAAYEPVLPTVDDLRKLHEMQDGYARDRQLSGLLRNSGGRKSTLVIVAIYVASLIVAAVASSVFADSISTLLALIAAVFVLASLATTGRFRTRMVPDFVGQLTRVAGSVTAGAALPFMVLAIFDPSRTNFRAFAGIATLFFVASIAADWVSALMIRRMWATGRLRSKALMIGEGRLANELAVELRLRAEYGVDLVGVIDLSHDGDLSDHVADQVLRTGADRLIVSPLEDEHSEAEKLVIAVRRALSIGVPTFVVPRLYQMGLGLDSMSPDRARGYPLVRIQRSAHPSLARRAKRLFDILVSGSVLFLAAPAMAAVALAVKVTSPGDVLFKQPRVGQYGKVFDMLKFRSMTESDNEHGERQSGHRVTSVGRVIRATSLDELPQFWNVLVGDMTLVGPRPERVSFVEEGLRQYPGYEERHRRPMGLTGLAQVAGLRGEETSIVERVKFDNLYIDQWSMGLDLQIMAKTVFAILLQTRYRRRERELAAALTEMPAHAELKNVIEDAALLGPATD